MNYFNTNQHLAQAIIHTQDQIQSSYQKVAMNAFDEEVKQVFCEVSEQQVSEQQVFEALAIACEFLLNSNSLPEGPYEVMLWLKKHRPDAHDIGLAEKITEAKSVREALRAAIRFETQVLSFYRKARKTLPGNSLQIEVVVNFFKNRVAMLKEIQKSLLGEFDGANKVAYA